ncbi:cilia- and flagella-associated protein 52 isoform X2 [Hylaeus volcanicus]|uniref:cilia- and flagella-associated protein 52 isoform X2 n=1 Tax=Hylaeus volcanicus TaxID=313075 RepID=UPI0023B7BB3D|nr:cilia- and flagella-associated protein 52 isoform X2 [Hylaeus volcanicus]
MDVKKLDLCGVIAFDGIIRNGLRLHPDGEHLVYAMGNNVTIRNVKTSEQTFLTGHKNLVSALNISPRGNLIASGQVSHQGFKAMVIIWDYEKREMKANYEVHKARVEDVCFTEDEQYLISLGGRDDGCILVWDIRNGSPLCGTFAGKESSGNAVTIARTNLCNASFVTAGEETFRLWRVDPKGRKLCGVDVKIGKIRRAINCAVVDEKDENVYCGTTSGDIIKSRLNMSESNVESKYPIMIGCYSKISRSTKTKPSNGELYAGGVTNLLFLQKQEMIVGTGNGTVELIEIPEEPVAPVGIKTKKLLVVPCIITRRKGNVCGPVTSMIRYKHNLILVATALCEIYEMELSSFHTRLLVTCHTSSIYDLAFPRDRSEIFATSSKHDIRVWKLITQKELLRITVPNFICSNLCFDRNGGTIISAWNDGAIRAFALNGGKLLFIVHRAHTKSVSAIAITNDDCKLVSGGCDGQVRVWNAKSETQQLLKVLKEHRGPITSLHVSPDDKNVISSSTDGTCIVWDVRNFTRKYEIQGNTMYMATCFVPSGVQVLTCGTDRKIAYWETLDGSLVREVEGSTTGTINAISVSPDGRYFLTGSDDFIVKLWEYRTASTVNLGLAHAAPITGCAFAPNGKFMITVSADGAIMIWKYPFETSSHDNGIEVSTTVCAS